VLKVKESKIGGGRVAADGIPDGVLQSQIKEIWPARLAAARREG
jgi:hypothetical protein